jgi:alkylhydroperoxidase family enzyme
MPRLRQVSRSEAPPEVVETYSRLFGDRDPVTQPGTATGTPGNWWTVWALVPEVLAHAQAGFALLNRPGSHITAYQREFGLTRAGFARGSQFVFSQHCKGARRAGIPDEKIEHIPTWQVSDRFDAMERAILAYTDAIVLEGGRVQDGVFAALKQHLSDEAILDLTYAISTYALHATISKALRLEYDDVPERIVEIPAPEAGAASADIMGQISRER